ncbi:MAG: hypothetical protein ACRDS0_38435, partial [Pseudonocardiaceae bacterium]
ILQTLLTLPPSPIGLQAFVPSFEAKADNLTAALADGRLRAVQGVARAVSDVWSNATGTVSFLQLFGIGAGFAVLISRAAWYAPAPLRRVQTRIGLAEARGQPIPAPIDPPRGPGSWA